MKIFPHFSIVGFCNTYLIGGKSGGDAILVDPGYVDNELISLIQERKYVVTDVLLTHAHENHVQGVKTLMKVYQPTLHGAFATIYGHPVHQIHHDSQMECAGFSVRAIHVPGHSLDSIVYRVGDALFTGDALSSGHVGNTSGYREHELLVAMVRQRILSLEPRLPIFPGHGAPSSIFIERLFNRDVEDRALYNRK